MKLSIITVCFNSSSTLNMTLDSIEDQIYENIECIIIDGGSIDQTLSIIKEYESKSKYLVRWISERDNGIYDAMNKGILESRGDVICFLNSDDMYMDNTVLNDVMHEFNQNDDIDIVYGNLIYVRRNNVNRVVRRWVSSPFYPKYFEHGNVPPHPTLFIKRTVYEEMGLFNLDFKLAADYEFMLRMFYSHKYKSIFKNKFIVKMRLGGATNQSFVNIRNQNREIIYAWEHNRLKMPFLLMPLRIIKRLKQFI